MVRSKNLSMQVREWGPFLNFKNLRKGLNLPRGKGSLNSTKKKEIHNGVKELDKILPKKLKEKSIKLFPCI